MSSIMMHLKFLLLLLLTTKCSMGQVTAKLTDIRKKVKSIDTIKNFTIISIDSAEQFLEQASDNGASLKGYFKNDILYKTVEWIGLSNGVNVTEIYYDKAKPIFVYQTKKTFTYDTARGTVDYNKLVIKKQWRYYFENGTLLYLKSHPKPTKDDDLSYNLSNWAVNYVKLLQEEYFKN